MNIDMGVIREMYEVGTEAGIDFGDIEPRNAHFITIKAHFDVDCGWIPNEFDDDHAAAIVRDKVREWLMEKHGIQAIYDKFDDAWYPHTDDGHAIGENMPQTYDLALLAAMKHAKEVK